MKDLFHALQTFKHEVLAGHLPKVGICNAVNHRADYIKLRYLAMDWLFFSGNQVFPIPPTDCDCPADQFHNYHKWEGMQLKLRPSLIDFMVEELQ